MNQGEISFNYPRPTGNKNMSMVSLVPVGMVDARQPHANRQYQPTRALISRDAYPKISLMYPPVATATVTDKLLDWDYRPTTELTGYDTNDVRNLIELVSGTTYRYSVNAGITWTNITFSTTYTIQKIYSMNGGFYALTYEAGSLRMRVHDVLSNVVVQEIREWRSSAAISLVDFSITKDKIYFYFSGVGGVIAMESTDGVYYAPSGVLSSYSQSGLPEKIRHYKNNDAAMSCYNYAGHQYNGEPEIYFIDRPDSPYMVFHGEKNQFVRMY